MREFKFPIFERKVSSNGQGASASAGIGVTGDVIIDISKPTCKVTFAPPFKLNSSIYSDVSISSNGYFGLRAEALGEKDFGISFSSNKGYGSSSKFTNMTLDENEKEAIAQLVLKSVDNAMEDEKILNDLANKIKDEFAVPMLDSLESALIGTDSAPFSSSKLCSLFEKAGSRIPGSEEDLVCWALSASEPLQPLKATLPPLVLPPEPPLPPRPSGVCSLTSKVNVPSCRVVLKAEFPLGCSVAKEAAEKANTEIDRVCSSISKWEKEVEGIRKASETEKAKLISEYETRKRQIEESYNKAFENWQRWNRYRNPVVVRNIAKGFVRNRILLSSDVIDSKAIARKFMDIVWKLEESNRKANEVIDLTENYLQKIIPERLSISIKASGRVAFDSRARLLETSPQFTNNSELEFKEGKPSLKLKFSAYKNRPQAQEGKLGGLAPIGVVFTAQQVACIGGTVEQDFSCSADARKIDIPEGKNKPLLTRTLGGEKISKNEIEVFFDSVTLPIKS
jgi:hypothetical protein